MRTAQRRLDPALIDQLIEAPHRFEFFQAVRMLDQLFSKGTGEQLRGGADLSSRIRFRNTLHQGFAAAEIETVRVEEVGNDSVSRAAPSKIEITPSFLGLLGVHGALPAHYTERITERERLHRDRAARALLDIFADRAVRLFYQSWKKHRLALRYECDRRKHFLPQVLSFAGLGFAPLRDRLAQRPGQIDDESIAGIAGILSQRPLSARGLERMLSTYFRVPMRIEQFVGKWYVLPDDQRCVLGGANVVLGRKALVGCRVWQRNLRIRLHIGPLSAPEYHAFLPGGDRAAALAKLLALASGSQFECEVRPILRACDVAPASIATERAVQLGRNAFVVTDGAKFDRRDALYELNSIN